MERQFCSEFVHIALTQMTVKQFKPFFHVNHAIETKYTLLINLKVRKTIRCCTKHKLREAPTETCVLLSILQTILH